jgi:hypothetical protein
MEWQAANFSHGPSSGGAQSEFAHLSLPRERDRRLFTQTFTLPGGYVDDEGVTHGEVELAPVTGLEEELLDSVGPAACSASVVTALLSRCVVRLGKLAPVPTSLIQDLLVGDREFLMLKLRELTFGKKLKAVLFCGNANCAESMDVMLNLDDLTPDGKPVTDRVFKVEVADEGEGNTFVIEFRLPTGADQEAVADSLEDDAESAVNRLLARTITRVNDNSSVSEQTVADLPARALKEIEDRMEELGSFITVELESACVECGRPFLTHLDVTSFFLAELKQSLRRLEREVHFIAWHYHWHERDILALTRRKRRRYVELIQGEPPDTFRADAHSRSAA